MVKEALEDLQRLNNIALQPVALLANGNGNSTEENARSLETEEAIMAR